MAWGAVGGAGLFQDTSAGTSITGTVTATIEAGNVALVVVAIDNLGTSDGDNSEVTSVTDSAGNTYQKLGEFTNANGSAGAGATVSVWASVLATQLVSTVGTVTANFSGSVTASAMIVHEFTVTAGAELTVAGTVQTLANDAADPGSMSLSGLTSREYLYVRCIASESNSTAVITTSASFTTLSRSVANTGTSATSMGARGEFRINTSTGETSDPTLFSADHASVFLAIIEAVPAGLAQPVLGTDSVWSPIFGGQTVR